MTRDDVIRMAQESGLNAHGLVIDRLENLANLVAAAEREACAKVVWKMAWSNEETFYICQAIRARGEK